ncbi:mucin-2 [Exaiptasia diaphana]|uniref:VWFD domain-containing protein n=1 Tax=Exaiptasia diaphana TaxID=2652724 RepID=A0A913X183_EXADI|nr:mucin-2-like [Exaiptasia diaphana]XP_020897326.1 mucin-2 [Exaiptasia diaphana]
MKFLFILLLLVLPAFLEATGESDKRGWWGRRNRRPKARPKPRPRPRYGYGGQSVTCSASGDPHYKTFDGKRYNFMGECRYIHTTDHCKVDCGRPRLGTFKVIAENCNCGRRVSCVKSAEVDIRGDKIYLRRGTFAPANKETVHYSVRREGNFVVVRTKPAGLTVKWDRNMGLHIYLTSKYKGKVCGLCGNFDGNQYNDFLKSNGKSAGNNVNDFAKSWQAGGKCGQAPITPTHPCQKNPHRRQIAEKDCAVILSNHFKFCKDAGVDVDYLYRNCLYDVCAEKAVSMKDSSCDAIKEASYECKDQTGKTVTWGHLEQKCKCQREVQLQDSYQTKCCVFPFQKNGEWHYDCVKSGQGSWCSTEKIATAHSIGQCVNSYGQR